MKKIATYILTITTTIALAQSEMGSVFDNDLMRVFARDGIIDKEIRKDVSGISYINETFCSARISGVNQPVMVSYNAEKDEVEYQNELKEVFNLIKKAEFGTISIAFGNYNLRLFNYVNSENQNKYGYLVVVSTDFETSLLRRDKINFIPEKKSSNGYAGNTPPRLVKADPEYYLEMKNKNIVLMPKNKKQIIEQFQSHKDKINTYFKENDLSFKKEEDLKIISQFIGTL